MQASGDLLERFNRTSDFDMSILFNDIVRACFDPKFKSFIKIHLAGWKQKICNPIELPTHRAKLCHVAARFRE